MNTLNTIVVVALIVFVAYKVYQSFTAPPTLDTVTAHLDKADDHLEAHKESLGKAQNAAVSHIVSKREEISGLSAAIGTAQSSINAANDHLAYTNERLSKVT